MKYCPEENFTQLAEAIERIEAHIGVLTETDLNTIRGQLTAYLHERLHAASHTDGTDDIANFSGAGTKGLVPDPATETGKFLRDDGTWTSAGSGSGHTIQDEGVDLTNRSNLNFIGASVIVTDNSGDDSTDVTIHNNIDGGSAASVYLTGQNIDGGGA